MAANVPAPCAAAPPPGGPGPPQGDVAYFFRGGVPALSASLMPMSTPLTSAA